MHLAENFTLPGLFRHAHRLAAAYAAARPFPHTVIPDLFPMTPLRAVAEEIPERTSPSGCVPGAAACYRKFGTHYRKSELHHNAMGPHTRRLFAALRSPTFVRFLEMLSGIGGLVPDPGFEGSGVHLTGNGGVLAVHHDFSARCGFGLPLCGMASTHAPLMRVTASRVSRPVLMADYMQCAVGTRGEYHDCSRVPTATRSVRLHRRVVCAARSHTP
jgi:hypothetical protein